MQEVKLWSYIVVNILVTVIYAVYLIIIIFKRFSILSIALLVMNVIYTSINLPFVLHAPGFTTTKYIYFYCDETKETVRDIPIPARKDSVLESLQWPIK